MKLPGRSFRLLLFILVFLSLAFFCFSLRPSLARAEWVPDPEVTTVGKSAERARQLVYWLFSRPSLDNSPAIREIWAVSRNIALVFLVLLVVGFGFQLIISKEKTKFEAFLPKLMLFMVLCVFSYVLVLGLIQIGDLVMKFFIERVAGENLFNITFSGGNIESNYTDFVGWRENSPENIESIKTSLLLIKSTTLTYNLIFIVLVLRKLFLWFLLIVSPFLPLLFAFPLIKNVGWVWIGVFFQWLFYGPLFSVFLAALVKIWEVGIPFGFDFSRANQESGQIFKTAINILYGGPQQSLSPLNSANYVDTYAEYLIGLIMLWAVMILPWLLLRTFRDYCCELLKSIEAATISLYGRMGGGGPPSWSPVSEKTKLELPFKKVVDRVIPATVSREQSSQIAKMRTQDLLETAGLKVSSLADISRLDMDLQQRRRAVQKLEQLKSPVGMANMGLRRQFSLFNQELMSRAAKGDRIAERTLSVASRVSVLDSKSSVASMARIIRESRLAQAGKEEKKPVTGLPVGSYQPEAPRAVSVEDYESVKKMWVKNYKEGDIPVSEEIKNRGEWLANEIAKISDAIEMVSSKDEETKQVGLEKVSAILPFLLLGGFTEEQTLVYLKAKLEAAKVVQAELEEVAKSATQEEVKIEVPRQKKEEKKEMELGESLEIGKEKN